MALTGREEQERRQMWKQAPANNDDDSEEDEVEGDEPMDIRGGGWWYAAGRRREQVEKEMVQAFMTENDKEEDEFDEMVMNGHPMQINFMWWINMYINLPFDLNIVMI